MSAMSRQMTARSGHGTQNPADAVSSDKLQQVFASPHKRMGSSTLERSS
jgi:hypothetical protein